MLETEKMFRTRKTDAMSVREKEKPVCAGMPGAAPGRRPNPARAPGDVERLAALGRLVGPLVRELRHPLGNLQAAADMLGEGVGPDDPSSGFVRLVHRETDRLQQTIEDLAMLTAPRQPAACSVDIVPMLCDILSCVERPAARQGIRIVTDCPDETLYVKADPDALRAVLARLPMQAIEAMPYGGTLTVGAETASGLARPFARVRFADTGPAVPERTLARMFEPFLVAEGRRPGMTLALCKATVESMDGRVFVRAGDAGGLTVELQLPLP